MQAFQLGKGITTVLCAPSDGHLGHFQFFIKNTAVSYFHNLKKIQRKNPIAVMVYLVVEPHCLPRQPSLYCTSLPGAPQTLRKAGGYPPVSKSTGAIFPTAFPHFVSLYHILVILTIFPTFSFPLPRKSLSWDSHRLQRKRCDQKTLFLVLKKKIRPH